MPCGRLRSLCSGLGALLRALPPLEEGGAPPVGRFRGHDRPEVAAVTAKRQLSGPSLRLRRRPERPVLGPLPALGPRRPPAPGDLAHRRRRGQAAQSRDQLPHRALRAVAARRQRALPGSWGDLARQRAPRYRGVRPQLPSEVLHGGRDCRAREAGPPAEARSPVRAAVPP